MKRNGAVGIFKKPSIFSGHLFQFSEGEDRAVLAHILISDIASSTNPYPALHPHLKRQDNPLRWKP
jgi:hypothetical protein